MAPKYIVVVSEVTPLAPGMPCRDERARPEAVVQSMLAWDRASAQTIFDEFCGLPQVRSGRQRVKVLSLTGEKAVELWSVGIAADANLLRQKVRVDAINASRA